MIAIIGAGIAGLQAACQLQQRGLEFCVLEAGHELGGLARTGTHKHWKYDYGVKALYSQDSSVMSYLRALPVEYVEHERQAAVHHSGPGRPTGLDISYPFENGIGELPHEDKVACVLGYLEASTAQKPFGNFQEWIVNRLGRGIAEQFMLPYNQKIWDCPLEEISLGLVANKIHPAPLEEIIRIALGEKIIGRRYQARFIYPRDGLNALTEAMAQPVATHIRRGFAVARVHARGQGYEIVSAGGERVACQAIISTLPLPRLASLMDEPAQWPQPAWRHNHTRFLIVFLSQAPANGLHWQFFADPCFPFYRLTYMHNFSDRFPPCLVAEATDRGQPLNAAEFLAALERIGVRPEWVAETRAERLEFTYPIPTLRSDAEKPAVIEAFEARHIYPLGRAGAWQYSNVDGIILQTWHKVPQILERECLP
jgi:protoporphyrinogen oxidase